MKNEKRLKRAEKTKKIIKKEKTKVREKKVKVKKIHGKPMKDEHINYSDINHLVEEFAVRWWYALPKWPPENYDYTEALKANNLRKVEVKNWKLEPEELDGLKKVFELETFEGVFKDSQGNTYDLRPMDTCPSLNNFNRMGVSRLQELLLKAYE